MPAAVLPFRITHTNLAASIPAAPSANVDAWAQPLSDAAVEFGIDTPAEVVALLASISAETSLSHFREDWVYTPARAMQIYGLSEPQVKQYQQNRETWFEFVYGYLSPYGKSMGNTLPGDGAKFYGKGPDQITGKNNCRAVSAATGVDFVANSDRLLDPVDGSRAVCAFWKINHIIDMVGDGTQASFLHGLRAMNPGLSDDIFLSHHLPLWFQCRRGCGIDGVPPAPVVDAKAQARDAQHRLNNFMRSIAPLDEDGDIGAKSQRMLRLYQCDASLSITGQLDAATRTRLLLTVSA